MEYKLMHRAYKPTIGGKAISVDKLINDLGEDANYIGTFSEFNPIALTQGMAITVIKSTTTTVPQKPFYLPGFRLESGYRFHGSDYNNNDSIIFNKQDLLRIANAMDDTDRLHIGNIGMWHGSINRDKFEDSIKQVVK